MRGGAPERLPSDAPSSTCSRLTCSGGQHVLVHGVEAEFVVGQTVDRDAVRRPGLPRLPGSVRISNMHRDLASILGDNEIRLQARDAAVDRQLLAVVDGLGALTGDLDHHAWTAFDERIVVGGIAQHLHIGVVVQVVGASSLWSEPTTRQLATRAAAKSAAAILSA